MSIDLIKYETREKFLNYLVKHSTYIEINALFNSEGIFLRKPFININKGCRGLIQNYYDSLDFSDNDDVKKVLAVYNVILNNIPPHCIEEKKILCKSLEDNGFYYRVYGKFFGNYLGKVVSNKNVEIKI